MPHDAHAPQLRTLLLTDLCDSTAMVEKLGDAAAATVFRDHDRLVLELQQRWRGRLIDRSDGLLLLFERPLDGLGFALDYRRGLDALGRAHRIGPLFARSGLHVGEVLIWRNSEAAISAGAKPVEVEGLAKPFTARLMQLARPGQILLSSVVEPLVRRSARELGERGDALQWRSWGRWYFKGVPEVQEVHEVGEPGFAPLPLPPGHAQARRDSPPWRRPAAIAAEVVVVLGVVVGGWFMTRPEPAIAFSERDWVVVGDLRNLTGDSRYDGAIEAALRTSLEQSQFVNVIPDSRAQGALALMRKKDAPIDRGNGVQIAQRTGARMLLLPMVSETGGKVRVDLEVVDPSNAATVLSLGAAGRGADSAIRSTGSVAESLRAQLGESTGVIAKSSLPLEQVTTGNIEALRAFTLAQRAYAVRDFAAADQHFRQALQLDPGFAMARIGIARVAYGRTDIAGARAEMEAALTNVNRLTDRERLYADAQLAQLGWEKGYLDKWIALSNLYPDFDVAAFNAALGLWNANRFQEMRDFSDRAVATQGVTLPIALKFRAIGRAGLGDPAGAKEDCGRSQGKGVRDPIECALFLAASREDAPALAGLQQVAQEPGFLAIERAAARLNVLADTGDWAEAEKGALAIMAGTANPSTPYDWLARSSALAVLAHREKRARVLERVAGELDQVERSLPGVVGQPREAVAMAALHAGYVAACLDAPGLARRAQEIVRAEIDRSPRTALANASAIVGARLESAAGRPESALGMLAAYAGPSALSLTEVEIDRARAELGDDSGSPLKAPVDAARRSALYAQWGAEQLPPRVPLVPLQ